MERNIFICNCHNLEHQFSFTYDKDDDEVYLEVRLTTYRNIFKRCWHAIKYVFGYKSRFGEFDTVQLDKESQTRLLNHLKETIGDKDEK